MKKKLALVLATAMITALVGCSSGGGESITLATGGASGTYYAVGGVLGQMLQNTAGIKTEVVTTGASRDNVLGITDGLYNMGILQNDVLAYAHTGTDMFEGDVEDTALWVAGIYNETVQIIATPDITDVSQLAGKAVVVGDAGSGTEFNARQILEAYGMTFDDITVQNASFQEGVDSLKDGKISAAFNVAGAPTTAIVDLDASGTAYNLVSLTEEAVNTITTNYPFMVREDLPAGTYGSQTEDVVCVAAKAVLVASKDLSEDTVYNATKAIFENLETLTTGHPKFGFLSLETALDGANVEIHPGAVKYYQECGIELPEV